MHSPALHAAALAAVLAAGAPCQQESTGGPPEPRTVPERTAWQQTSTHADVGAFLQALAGLPHADRLSVSTFGKSHEGRDLWVVRAALPGDGSRRLRVLVNADIHAGEVEGKEAVQILLREIAYGEHEELLRTAEIRFVPIYNADGNERIDKRNRVSQNGPEGGVGQRPNAQGLDLNRDFVKAESPECQALLSLCREFDPHLFFDLHTTNGSPHGYHLTYAPSLSPNVDERIDRCAREILDEVRQAVADRHGFRVFDYGNFPFRDGQRRWSTYDHRPRFGTNYIGLRNRFSVLSEAYSYCDFETRTRVTRAFVLECLRAAAGRAAEIRELCAAADRRLVEDDPPVFFGYDTTFGPAERLEVLVGKNRQVPLGELGTRIVATGEFHGEEMDVFRSFRARKALRLPAAWALPEPPAALVANLRHHGVEFELLPSPRDVAVERFVVTDRRKSRREFQGHFELTLTGAWQPPAEAKLPAGTLWVPARQPLGRLAAQLLEPQSEDSLSTWNFLEDRTDESYPVLRVTGV